MKNRRTCQVLALNDSDRRRVNSHRLLRSRARKSKTWKRTVFLNMFDSSSHVKECLSLEGSLERIPGFLESYRIITSAIAFNFSELIRCLLYMILAGEGWTATGCWDQERGRARPGRGRYFWICLTVLPVRKNVWAWKEVLREFLAFLNHKLYRITTSAVAFNFSELIRCLL